MLPCCKKILWHLIKTDKKKYSRIKISQGKITCTKLEESRLNLQAFKMIANLPLSQTKKNTKHDYFDS